MGLIAWLSAAVMWEWMFLQKVWDTFIPDEWEICKDIEFSVLEVTEREGKYYRTIRNDNRNYPELRLFVKKETITEEEYDNISIGATVGIYTAVYKKDSSYVPSEFKLDKSNSLGLKDILKNYRRPYMTPVIAFALLIVIVIVRIIFYVNAIEL